VVAMTHDPFASEISRHVWDSKYRWRQPGGVRDASILESWRRIAHAVASVEKPAERDRWEKRFFSLLENFGFLPGGRIQAGAGTGHRVTLFNCFVMGVVHDSIDAIFDALKEGALTMQQGGGVGYDFSTLRPSGTPAVSVGVTASGPVSFMHIWDAMCATILSTGARRGAMMATLRCDHPDIETFIQVKRDPARLRHFNLSVLVSDAFMQAVRDDADWPLVFPLGSREMADAGRTVEREWSGSISPVRCRIYRTVRARSLWDQIMQSNYDYAEPGVIFIDRVNAQNNLAYRERISATNPCGELPLPPYGACNLGSINLTRFVRDPFSDRAGFDIARIVETASVATRFLDNVTDLSAFPMEKQRQTAHAARRIGLGLTGLGDALIMLGVSYGSADAVRLASEVMRCITESAYRTSIDLASEKGVFPGLDREQHLARPFIEHLSPELRAGIARYGIRNSHLTAIAPTGTISLLANSISSGLEPVFRFEHKRKIREADGTFSEHRVTDFAYRLYRELRGPNTPLTPAFVTAGEISPFLHLDMQAALQPWVDSAISKTINVPQDYSFSQFRSLYEYSYNKGLKGCTTYRPNPITGQVLVELDEQTSGAQGSAVHCCTTEREAD